MFEQKVYASIPMMFIKHYTTHIEIVTVS